MRRTLLLATPLVLIVLGGFGLFVSAGFHGPDTRPARLLESAYPLWGWFLEACDSRGLHLPSQEVFDEIRGRHLASRMYPVTGWHFIGTGMSSTTLVGIDEPDRPIRLLPQLERCAILYSPYSNPPHGLGEGDQVITCYMRDGEIVEFEALVWPHPCIHEPWLDGYNRKMIELLAVDGNWPPTDDHRRATVLSVRETWDAISHLNWPS